jgi:hypothetical protein
VDAGDIRVSITQSADGKRCVQFHEATFSDGLAMERVDLARLVEQTQQVAKISEQMREEELRIICKPQYLMRHLGGNAEALGMEDIECFTPTQL